MENHDRMQHLLQNAKTVLLTTEENAGFVAMNKRRDWTNLPRLVAKISERTGIPLSSGRIAHDEFNKRLLIVD
jgi:hypothetical protein